MALPATLFFPVVRLRFEAIVESPFFLPQYAGSALRGVFGHALRRLACMTKQPTCDGCSLRKTCPYAAIFESLPPSQEGRLERVREAPKPYVIEPPLGQRVWQEGETLSFHLVLMGDALRQLPLLVFAWKQALARGVGPAEKCGKGRLLRVWQTDLPEGEVCVFDAEAEGEVLPCVPMVLPPTPAGVTAYQLSFYSPLRIQQNGCALSNHRLSVEHLLRALFRRQWLLARCYGEGRDEDMALLPSLLPLVAGVTESRRLVWHDWQRFSNRQQRKMVLGGLLGRWELVGDLSEVWPLLWYGQFLHVGKEAVFGCGGYRLTQG